MPLKRKSSENLQTPRRSQRIKYNESIETQETKHPKSSKRFQHEKTQSVSSSASATAGQPLTRRTSITRTKRTGYTTKTSFHATEKHEKKVPRPTSKSSTTLERRILKPIHLGDTLPDIILKNELGDDVHIQNIADEYPVIIFAYPKASTPGCTVQGCGFRDNYSTIESKNYRIYGLSMDTPKAQLAFKTKQNFPYHLLSDPKAELIGALGASKSGFKIARSHWIFNKGGVLLDMKIGVSPKDSVEKIAWYFVLFLRSKKESSFLGDFSHLASVFILLQKIRKSRSCSGISFKSQVLFSIVYFTRYIGPFKPTNDPNIDTFKIQYLIGVATILALLFPGVYTPVEISWCFSIWLESVAILPQLLMLQRTGEAENLTTHYLFCLGLYRALYIPNWIYRYIVEGFYDVVAIIAGLIQTGLYADFFWLYYTKVLYGKKFELPA
ncbi:hypothetical protein PMAC_002896 [Pneumocystis sp. 'macacae']|nr:hypothetical protein PMAC_002896 [Pneumocystis sp. 'macacae']